MNLKIAKTCGLHLGKNPIPSEFTELTQVDGSILKEPLKAIDGFLAVPEGPGFGVKIDEDALKEYALTPQ